MKGDFSRSTFQSDRPYTGVRMQQGRVPVDADWNEQVDITDYQRRRAIADIIGGCCIPESAPDSFRVSVSGREVRVEGGRAWVQGALAERADAQTLAAPAAPGRYVVYLEVFERHVTAIEDPDIREVALGGPDTATRTATVCRAGIAPIGENQTCAHLRGFVPPGQTTGQLTASTGTQPPETPCVVPTSAGYARLENQLYRIEVQRSGTAGGANPPTFKWSRDNGSVAAEWLALDGNEIVIASPGRDSVLGFQENRWIELGHDALDLAGGTGPVVEVVGRRTDSQGRFRLQFDAHGQSVPDPSTLGHPKVRRWDHDAGSDPSSGAIPIVANTPIAIEGGIEIRFSAGTYRAGDYWMIPARTFSGASIGDILWPRDAGGTALPQPPNGVARSFCRLAVIEVTSGAGAQFIDECRRTFPSLCGLEHGAGGGCCTVTVGVRGGQVATIAEALARLPAEGGQICILPGIYRERVELEGRRDVTIHGCGPRTRIVAPDGAPACSLRRVNNVTVMNLSIEALEGLAVRVDEGRDVTIEGVDVTSRDRTAIAATSVQHFVVCDSSVTVSVPEADDALASRRVAVFADGLGLRIERNHIRAHRVKDREDVGGGGLQIGGGSSDVVIAANLIDDGFGPGVVLGSVTLRVDRPDFGRLVDDLVARRETDVVRTARNSALDGAVAYHRELRREPGAARAVRGPSGALLAAQAVGRGAVSDGDLADVRILGNTIRRMGGSGITVARFFDLQEGEGDFISIRGLEIAGNRIEDCLRVLHEPVPSAMAEDAALGGIALADAEDLVVRDNVIEGNGAHARNPACGVFVLHGLGLDIHRNVIRHNGMPPQADPVDRPGRRGGIVVGYAEVPTRDVLLAPDAQVPRQRQDGTPALRIHDNVVVSPEGRAIEAVALGPVSIQGNQLTALGSAFRDRSARSPLGLDVPEGSPLGLFTGALGGAVVSVFDLGVSNELFLQLLGFAGLGLADTLAQPDTDAAEDRPVLAGGNIQFDDNQVVLDALDGVSTFALSAVSLFTLDDIAMSDNQCDCDLVLDLVALNALAFGFSVRATSNRFKEGLVNAFYSAMTIGYLNSTTDNQGTHCFVRVGKQIPASHSNMVLRQLLPGGQSACERVLAIEKQLQGALFGG